MAVYGVAPGIVEGSIVFLASSQLKKPWMAGKSPAMTTNKFVSTSGPRWTRAPPEEARDLRHWLALPHTDNRRPQRRIPLSADGCLVNVAKDATHSRLRRNPQLNRPGQKAVAQVLVMRHERFKRCHWKIDVSAIGRAYARFNKIDRQLESEFHVLTRALARFEDDSEEFGAGFELRVQVGPAEVQILNRNVPPRLGPADHRAKHGNRISGQQKRKPFEGQVEQVTADLVGGLHIRFDEAVSTCSCCRKPSDCFVTGFGVAV